jgi:hypothetical protein
MDDRLEIIATVKGETKPRTMKFEELYPVKDDLETVMFLWNTNSYYVDCLNNTMIINGGRRFRFGYIGESKLIYRKRTAMTMTIAGEQSNKSVWLVGLEGINEDQMVLLEIEYDGSAWRWLKSL